MIEILLVLLFIVLVITMVIDNKDIYKEYNIDENLWTKVFEISYTTCFIFNQNVCSEYKLSFYEYDKYRKVVGKVYSELRPIVKEWLSHRISTQMLKDSLKIYE
jgi:hypothetical protein